MDRQVCDQFDSLLIPGIPTRDPVYPFVSVLIHASGEATLTYTPDFDVSYDEGHASSFPITHKSVEYTGFDVDSAAHLLIPLLT
jgi:hypothetical protein